MFYISCTCCDISKYFLKTLPSYNPSKVWRISLNPLLRSLGLKIILQNFVTLLGLDLMLEKFERLSAILQIFKFCRIKRKTSKFEGLNIILQNFEGYNPSNALKVWRIVFDRNLWRLVPHVILQKFDNLKDYSQSYNP